MGITLTLLPGGKQQQVIPGTLLRNALPAGAVELICSGLGTCGKCKVQVVRGLEPPTATEQALLSPQELARGIRLACSFRLEQDTTVLLPAKETVARASWLKPCPESDLLLAVDLGSTNLKLALVKKESGEIVAEAQVANRQKEYGADVLSRQYFANEHPHGSRVLQLLVVESLNTGLDLLRKKAPAPFKVAQVAIAGNSIMLALLLGLQLSVGVDIAQLVRKSLTAKLTAADLGIQVDESARLCLLPPLASYVGSDLLACLLATDISAEAEPTLLMDVGTNVELALCTPERILVCSTAAGPAFEGGEISCGMSAARGAIHTVTWQDGRYQVQTIGDAPAQGVCGSGLFSAVVAARRCNQLAASGRLVVEKLQLTDKVALTQQDIRQFQLAKAAVRTGIDLLLEQARTRADEIQRVYLAGDFGQHVTPSDLATSGLLPAALVPRINKLNRGCIDGIITYCRQDAKVVADLLSRIEHVELAAQSTFQERFVSNMSIGPAVAYKEAE